METEILRLVVCEANFCYTFLTIVYGFYTLLRRSRSLTRARARPSRAPLPETTAMGYSSLHDAVMDASVTHVMNQMSPSDVDIAAANAGSAPSSVSPDEGYDQLRSSIDESIAALVATKEQVNMAESTNDPSLLKAASASLTASLDNSTSFWEVQVRPKAVYSVVHEKRVRMKRSSANATNAISAPFTPCVQRRYPS